MCQFDRSTQAENVLSLGDSPLTSRNPQQPSGVKQINMFKTSLKSVQGSPKLSYSSMNRWILTNKAVHANIVLLGWLWLTGAGVHCYFFHYIEKSGSVPIPCFTLTLWQVALLLSRLRKLTAPPHPVPVTAAFWLLHKGLKWKPENWRLKCTVSGGLSRSVSIGSKSVGGHVDIRPVMAYLWQPGRRRWRCCPPWSARHTCTSRRAAAGCCGS